MSQATDKLIISCCSLQRLLHANLKLFLNKIVMMHKLTENYKQPSTSPKRGAAKKNSFAQYLKILLL